MNMLPPINRFIGRFMVFYESFFCIFKRGSKRRYSEG